MRAITILAAILLVAVIEIKAAPTGGKVNVTVSYYKTDKYEKYDEHTFELDPKDQVKVLIKEISWESRMDPEAFRLATGVNDELKLAKKWIEPTETIESLKSLEPNSESINIALIGLPHAMPFPRWFQTYGEFVDNLLKG